MKPYFATGRCEHLKHAMEICAAFSLDHPAPHDEHSLLAYSQALGPALAQLHKVGAEYVSAVQNLS